MARQLRARRRRQMSFAGVRDVVLLVAGLLLLGHETLVVVEPRYLLIGIAAAMIGLPATLLADRRFVTSTPSPSPPGLDPAPDLPPSQTATSGQDPAA